MKRCSSVRAAALAAALFASHETLAENFNDRWSALARNSQASADATPAPAPAPAPQAEKAQPAESKRATKVRRHRAHSRRHGRHREWYKGGKKWHYVSYRRRR